MAAPTSKLQLTTEDFDKAIHTYLHIWNGDLTLVDSLFSPNLKLEVDLFPTQTGQGTNDISPLVNTSAAFGGWVQQARSQFETYTFTLNKWAGSGNCVAARWTLHATIGQNFAVLPTNLKAGDPVTYNGTDFLTLDPSTGLVVEVAVAQDLLTFLDNLGNEVTFSPKATRE
ncbi:hypothetical protein GQ53DRAFT_527111 [Thozetella sp. PMI_491]|nr:hypothetical protein GQ53DRAFT_527111 [Thozetella sp. PMI_491]